MTGTGRDKSEGCRTFPMISQTSSCLSFLVSATHKHTYQMWHCPLLQSSWIPARGSCLMLSKSHFVKSIMIVICILHFFLFLLCRYLHIPCLSGIGVESLAEVHFRVVHVLISKVPLWSQPFYILLSLCLGSTHSSSPRLLQCKIFVKTRECVVGLFGVKGWNDAGAGS